MNLVIKKWIQPYLLLEYLKDFYNVTDLTFNGATKNIYKQQMYDAVKSGSIGLYMKNVNKFYLLEAKSDADLVEIIKENLELTYNDLIREPDSEKAVLLVDMGKSEASFIF